MLTNNKFYKRRKKNYLFGFYRYHCSKKHLGMSGFIIYFNVFLTFKIHETQTLSGFQGHKSMLADFVHQNQSPYYRSKNHPQQKNI